MPEPARTPPEVRTPIPGLLVPMNKRKVVRARALFTPFNVTRTHLDLPLAATAASRQPATALKRPSRRAILGAIGARQYAGGPSCYCYAPPSPIEGRPPSPHGLLLTPIDNGTPQSAPDQLRSPPVPASARLRNAPRPACVPILTQGCGCGTCSRAPSPLLETSSPAACAHHDGHVTRLRGRWIAFTATAAAARFSFSLAVPYARLSTRAPHPPCELRSLRGHCCPPRRLTWAQYCCFSASASRNACAGAIIRGDAAAALTTPPGRLHEL